MCVLAILQTTVWDSALLVNRLSLSISIVIYLFSLFSLTMLWGYGMCLLNDNLAVSNLWLAQAG